MLDDNSGVLRFPMSAVKPLFHANSAVIRFKRPNTTTAAPERIRIRKAQPHENETAVPGYRQKSSLFLTVC